MNFTNVLDSLFKPPQKESTAPQPTKNDSPVLNVRRKGVTKKEVQALYKAPRSFVDYLPWVESLEGEDAILLEDNQSVGAVYEVSPRGTEGRTETFLTDVRDTIEDAMQDVFEESDTAPWVIQTFTFNESELTDFVSGIESYVNESAKGTQFTETYLSMIRDHYKSVCKPGGLFFDKTITNTDWSGCIQRNYIVIYRRYGANYKWNDYAACSTPLEVLNDVCEKFFNALTPLGIQYRRLSGREFHFMMTRWFNTFTDLTPDNPLEFSNLVDYGDETLPFGDKFTETMFYCLPRADAENKAWWFDRAVARCIAVDGIKRRPKIGHTTGETKKGDFINTMMDQLPEGCVMVSTIVVTPTDTVDAHILKMEEAAIGTTSDAIKTKQDCNQAKIIMGARHKMYRAKYAFYVRSKTVIELNKLTNKTQSILLSHGFRPIAVEDDIMSLNNYLLNLPMVYNAEDDCKSGWRQAQLTWVQHIANMSSIFGRSVGTGNPGVLQFNRGGEPLVFDPMNKEDRVKNAHMLVVGPTGAGKSATLSAMFSHVLAIYRPRMFIIEAGNSFGLSAEWWKSQGLSVNIVSLKPGSGVTLPTFADALKLLGTDAETATLDDDEFGIEDNGDDDVQRDILGELETIATLMITGGEAKEIENLRRPHKRIIRDAILLAAKNAQENNEVVLTQHVREALYQISKDESKPPETRQQIWEMGDSVGLFCDGFAGEIFNGIGSTWPECDVTLIDLAHFAREGYEAHLSISVISLLNMVNNIAERDQHSSRQIIVPIDEAHIITKNPLLSPYLVKIVKMWRKLGAWLWLATQNMEDFPDKAITLLNMIEWWVCLVMPKQEIQHIKNFKQLTPEQESLLLSASKADRQYTEGVVLAKNVEALFRSVPPSLMLALAMTEQHEKAERYQYMKENNATELEAAFHVAKQIDKARGIQ